MDFLLPFLAMLAGWLIGYAIAWQRVEFDLQPRKTAFDSGALSAFAAVIWHLEGGHDPILILFAGLGPLVCIDWKRKLLPDAITLPMIFIGVLVAFAQGRFVDAALGASLGYLAFRALGWTWERLRGVDALGRGDAKLFSAIGAFLGWAALPEIAFIAAMLGIALGVFRRMRTGEEEIPFGPALAAAALIVWAEGPFLPV